MTEQGRHRLAGVFSAFACLMMLTGLMVLSADSAEAYPDNAWIVGHVTDGTNPVANVYIKAMLFMGEGEDMNWTMTDLNGDYSMMVPGGLSYVVFAANGSYYMVMSQVLVDPGETENVDFTLAPIAVPADVTISGYVTDEFGSPRWDGHVLGIVNDPLGGDAPYYANVTTPEINTGYFEVKVIAGPNGGGAIGMDFDGYPMAENDTDEALQSGMSYTFNVELQPRVYDDDAAVYGYVTEIGSGLPLASAIVSYESDYNMDRRTNWTLTDEDGYYMMGVHTGNDFRMTFQRSGYTMKSYQLGIMPGETVRQDAALRGTDAKISGNVTDEVTHNPIMFARVFLIDDPYTQENMTMAMTDSSGYFELDAFSGTGLFFGAQQDGYAMNYTTVDVNPGDELWYDMTLMPYSSWLIGQVTDVRSGAPLAGASVHLMGPNEEHQWTDETGMYNFSLIPGDYVIEVNYWGGGGPGYRSYNDTITIMDGVEYVLNIALLPWDNALLKGHVYDIISGAPVQDANIWIGGEMWGNGTKSDMTGYYEMFAADTNYTLWVNAPDYQGFSQELTLYGLTETTLDLYLMPNNPPETALLHGYVLNSDDLTPIMGAEVRVRIDGGMWEKSTVADAMGYYEMNVPPWGLNVRSTSNDHAPYFSLVNLSGMMDYALDIQLDRDLYEPNLTFSQTPTENISWSNPSFIQAMIEEENLREMTLIRFMEWNSSGLDSNWTMIDWKRTTFDPWNPESGLPFAMDDGNYSVNDMWSGTAQAGWLSNGVDSDYLPASSWPWYMEPVYALSGFYTNSTSPRTEGSALFNASTGAFVAFMPRDQGFPGVFAPDPTGVFEPQDLVVEYNDGIIVDFGWRSLDAWSVNGLNLIVDDEVPSGNYKTEFYANDWGGKSNWTNLINLTVDQVSPTAVAGPDQNVPTNAIVTLNGSASYDNVGIAVYMWEFYNATGQWTVLYGDVATCSFEIAGSYQVNLTVWDGANHMSMDSLTVDVFTDLPPVANAGIDQFPDEDTTVTFDGNGSYDDFSIDNYTWFISELSVEMYGVGPQYVFSDPGVYHVQLVVRDSTGQSSAPDEVVITVGDGTPPTAYAGLDQYVLNGTDVVFNGSGSWDNVGIVDYAWSFFDVMPVEIHGMTVNHTFSAPGFYQVTLTARDAAGNLGYDSLFVNVDARPIANAGPDQTVDEHLLVTFDGSDSWDDDAIAEYAWTIVELAVDMYGVSPQYTFDDPGTYHVTLVVTDSMSQISDPDEMILTISDATDPTPEAGSDQLVPVGTLVTMNGSGSTDNVGIDNYTWSFFDVVSVELYGVEVNYTFNIDGSYLVTLTVRDAAGNWATDTVLIDVFSDALPDADAGPDQTVDEGVLVIFDGANSTDDNGIVNYSWTIFELSIVLYEVGPSYTFGTPGVYHVWLTVYDTIGQASDPDEVVITVDDITPPTAVAGDDQLVNDGTVVTLNGTASTDNVAITQYVWVVYDSTPIGLNGPIVTYTFSGPGAYWVDLYVGDAAGNSAVDTLQVVVNGPPDAATAGDQWISPGDDAYLDGWWCWDDLDGPYDLQYTWSFMYGGSEVVLVGYDPDAWFQFLVPGEYNLNLMVTDTGGLTDNATMRIYVLEYMSTYWVDPRTGDTLVDGSTISLDYVTLRGSVESWEEVDVVTPIGVYQVWADEYGMFEVTPLWLSDGLNIVTVRSYSDYWGETMTWFKMIQSDTYCRLWVGTVESPTSSSTVYISGWTDAGATVEMNGLPVSVLPDGTFGEYVSLSEGLNVVSIVATDAVGNTNSVDLDIELDTTPPALFIDGPLDGSTVSEPNVLVYGTVDLGATVTVNGLPATGGTSWSVTVSLLEGANVLVVIATDSVGNSMMHPMLTVNYVPPDYVTPEELDAVRTELLGELSNLSAALDENVSALQDQIDAAMGEITALQTSLLENITNLQGQIDGAMDDILALQTSLAENISALQDQIDAAMDQIAALQVSVGENITDLQGQIDVAMAEIADLQVSLLENVTALQTDIAEAMADIVSLESALTDNVTALQNQISDAVLDISDLQSALAENVTALESDIAALETALLENVTALEQAIAQNATDLQQALSQNVTALQSQIAALRADLQANVTSLTGAIAENVTALQGLVSALDQDVADLQTELAAMNTTLTAAQDQIEDAIDSMQTDLTDLQEQIDEIEQATQDVEDTADETDSFAGMLMYLTLILFAIAIVMVALVWYLANKKFGKGGAGKSEESLEEVEPPSEVEKEFESLEKEIKDEEL